MNDMKEITVPAQTRYLDEISSFVLSELKLHNCSAEAETQVLTAVEEIFVNIASYAYRPEIGNATIRCRVSEEPLQVTIQFMDEGTPYNPLEKKAPDISLPAEERSIGGLGIYLVKTQMDGADYEYSNGMNIFTINKRLAKQ